MTSSPSDIPTIGLMGPDDAFGAALGAAMRGAGTDVAIARADAATAAAHDVLVVDARAVAPADADRLLAADPSKIILLTGQEDKDNINNVLARHPVCHLVGANGRSVVREVQITATKLLTGDVWGIGLYFDGPAAVETREIRAADQIDNAIEQLLARLDLEGGSEYKLYDDLSIAVCAVNAAYEIVYFNASFAAFTKLPPRKLRQKALKDVLTAPPFTQGDLVARCFKDGLPVVSEETTFELGGEPRNAIFKAIPFVGADGASQVVVTIQDNSIERILHAKHRMQLDELKAKNAEIQRYTEGLELLVEERTRELREAMDQSERLLLSILPRKFAERLKAGEATIADRLDAVSVLFVDIVSFTTISSGLDPVKVVAFLGAIFDGFDRLVDKYNVEKIKTIGDCYLAVAGVPVADPRHAANLCDLALAMQHELAAVNRSLGTKIEARYGINSGPIVAGVIGQRKFAFDIWGDTVNVASRMESHGACDRIQISESTYRLVKDEFECEERGTIDVKGKGQTKAYWLVRRKA